MFFFLTRQKLTVIYCFMGTATLSRINNKMHPNVSVLFLLGLFVAQSQADLLGILNSIGLNFLSNGQGSVPLGNVSRGCCPYSFASYALMEDHNICIPDDKHIMHLIEQWQPRKVPIMVKCLQADMPVPHTMPIVLVMKSAKEIVSILKPIGNATKRHEPGNCVLVHFCISTSLECARVAKLVNILPHRFPTLPIAYIDAYEFTRFNAEFGIIEVPTLMLFHQGRPIIKHETGSPTSFIKRHTNMKRDIRNIAVDPYHQLIPLSTIPVKKTDFYLILAWAFILLSLGNYLRRTLLWKKVVEMVKRNWRESEETQLGMND